MATSSFAPPGDVQTLCWRSVAQLERLGAGLRAVLDPWARDWGLGSPTVELVNAWQALSAADLIWQPVAAGPNGQTVAWLGASAGLHEGLAGVLFGAGPDAGDSASLARSLADDALAALQHHVTQWLVAARSDPASNGALPEADIRPWSGAVRAVITLEGAHGSVSFWLHLRACAWPQPGLAGAASVSRTAALTPVGEALAVHTLKLQARLADVHVSLGELIGLREGDVLVTSHRLDAPLAITSTAGENAVTVFQGRLSQRQGRMAVALLQAR